MNLVLKCLATALMTALTVLVLQTTYALIQFQAKVDQVAAVTVRETSTLIVAWTSRIEASRPASMASISAGVHGVSSKIVFV